MTNKVNEKKTVVCQTWEESEAGWGCRPDGVSLHKTSEDHKKFLDRVGTPGTAEEYSRPVGQPIVIDVPKELFDEIKKDGIFVSDYRMRQLGMKYGSGWKTIK